jgi:hypothetical protein
LVELALALPRSSEHTHAAGTKGFFKQLGSAVGSLVDDKPGNEVDDWLWKTLLTHIRTRMGEPNTPQELVLQGILTAMDNIMPAATDASAKGRDPVLNAKFCHAGVGVGLTRAALPAAFDEVVWDVGNHHSLNLISECCLLLHMPPSACNGNGWTV